MFDHGIDPDDIVHGADHFGPEPEGFDAFDAAERELQPRDLNRHERGAAQSLRHPRTAVEMRLPPSATSNARRIQRIVREALQSVGYTVEGEGDDPHATEGGR